MPITGSVGRDGKLTLGATDLGAGRNEGLARHRFTTSHPNDMDDALSDATRHLRQVMPVLHLPVQSDRTYFEGDERKHTHGLILELNRPDSASRAPDYLVVR